MMIAQRGIQRFLLTAVLAATALAPSIDARAGDGRGTVRAGEDRVLLAQAAARPAAARNTQAELDALVAAARKEGEVTFYVSQTGFGERIVEGFTKKYGIKTQFVRAPGAALLQRYSSEAAAGNITADLLLQSALPLNFVRDGLAKGWFDPIKEAGIPVLDSGAFPARFTDGLSATVTISPWILVYNTDRVKGNDIPKDWRDLLNPKFKGQVLVSDPRSADAYFDLWTLFLDKYGEGFFTGMRGQNPRLYSSAVPATQALAAGEGSVMLATSVTSANLLKTKGAPIETVVPDLTTGIESAIMMTKRSRAKHPNAGRLLAQYLMSAEGNKWMNATAVGIYEVKDLPKNYQSPHPDALQRKGTVVKLLGL